jgi:hypothetical protein
MASMAAVFNALAIVNAGWSSMYDWLIPSITAFTDNVILIFSV